MFGHPSTPKTLEQIYLFYGKSGFICIVRHGFQQTFVSWDKQFLFTLHCVYMDVCNLYPEQLTTGKELSILYMGRISGLSRDSQPYLSFSEPQLSSLHPGSAPSPASQSKAEGGREEENGRGRGFSPRGALREGLRRAPGPGRKSRGGRVAPYLSVSP